MTIQSTLLFSALFALLAASIYAYVGWRLSKRVIPSSRARLAWGSFTVWWYGLAGTTLISGLLNLFGAFGLTESPTLCDRHLYQYYWSSVWRCWGFSIT